MIYLDNNGTTRVAPAVFEAMVPWLTEHYGNPSSLYPSARRARQAVEDAREQVALLLGCQPRQVIFTSCGTESDNAAILAALRRTRRRHIVTTRIEHSAVLKLAAHLERNAHAVAYAPVGADGRVTLEALQSLVRQDTAVVSVMWANNETGVINPIEDIAIWCHNKGLLFHTDAVQVPGKVPLNLSALPIDYAAFSGHKFHAPKGVGILYVREPDKLGSILHGGGQEHGLRGGTENVASIVGLGVAATLARENLDNEILACAQMRDHFEREALNVFPDARINGDRQHRLPNTSSLCLPGLQAAEAVKQLGELDICLSAGSACTSGSGTASHVLTAMGLSESDAQATLRLSWSGFNTPLDGPRAIQAIASVRQAQAATLQTA